MQWLVPPVGFARWGKFVRAVVHEVAEVFPDFCDVLDVGLGGFVAVDPEAILLVQAAVLSARGEGEGVSGTEG
ncbi:hypothetical protein PPUN109347_27300 [Pseudomonas putida]|nr:hypothetical protein PPUN109347_27300 [Pseudomonas putida]